MSYDFPKVHKAEDNLMVEINDMVYDHILEFYGVDEIEEPAPKKKVNSQWAYRLKDPQYTQYRDPTDPVRTNPHYDD